MRYLQNFLKRNLHRQDYEFSLLFCDLALVFIDICWFGLDFIEGKTALYVLLFGQLINVLCGPVGYILMMTNKQKILRNIIVVSALLNISLNILLIPEYGILGAAFATTASLILWNISSLIYVYKKYGFITINIAK